MVGEIRDTETASLAINAALTGHLVLSTLHTNSAVSTISKLLDMGVEPLRIVSTLRVVIGQRLVRMLKKEKEKYFLSKDELVTLGKTVDLPRVLWFLKEEKIVPPDATWSTIPFYRPAKRTEDDGDGFKGRIGIHETFAMSSAIKELVRKGATSDAIEKQAKQEGMMTMIEDGIFKAVQGITTLEEVLNIVGKVSYTE